MSAGASVAHGDEIGTTIDDERRTQRRRRRAEPPWLQQIPRAGIWTAARYGEHRHVASGARATQHGCFDPHDCEAASTNYHEQHRQTDSTDMQSGTSTADRADAPIRAAVDGARARALVSTRRVACACHGQRRTWIHAPWATSSAARFPPAQPHDAPPRSSLLHLTGGQRLTGGQLGRGEAASGARSTAEDPRDQGIRSRGRAASGHRSGVVRRNSPHPERSLRPASHWLARCTSTKRRSNERRAFRPGSRQSDGRLTLDGVRLNERDRWERDGLRGASISGAPRQGHPHREPPHAEPPGSELLDSGLLNSEDGRPGLMTVRRAPASEPERRASNDKRRVMDFGAASSPVIDSRR